MRAFCISFHINYYFVSPDTRIVLETLILGHRMSVPRVDLIQMMAPRANSFVTIAVPPLIILTKRLRVTIVNDKKQMNKIYFFSS